MKHLKIGTAILFLGSLAASCQGQNESVTGLGNVVAENNIPNRFNPRATPVTDDMWVSIRTPYKELSITSFKGSKSVADILPDYPENWVGSVQEMTLSLISNQEKTEISNSTTSFNDAQLALLDRAAVGDDIVVHVDYERENSATGEVENREIHVGVTLIPFLEAQHELADELNKFVRKECVKRLLPITDRIMPATVSFWISESGTVTGVGIEKSTGNADADAVLIDIVKSLKDFTPARNDKGETVPQRLILSLGDSC